MDKDGFDLAQLLYDILGSDKRIGKWQDVEQVVVQACKKQDPKAIRNTETDPDVSLSNGLGIEAKSTTSLSRGINLNSAAPDPNTFYVVVYHYLGKISNVAIVSGQNFYCPEIIEIKKTNTRLRTLSNKFLRYRTRIMWQMRSPFEIWDKGNFIVDKLGNVKRY
jgi:flagellar hook protein FlgE